MMAQSENSEESGQNALDIKNLEVYFGPKENGLRIIDDISFHVDRGEILGLVGESGSGKSVTCLAAMALLGDKWNVDGAIQIGKTRIDDSLSKQDLANIRGRQVAMIFQDANASLNPIEKIGKQLTDTVARLRGISQSKAKEVALDLLRKVEMPDPEERFHSYPFQLSGGQNQRVMIAIAVAGNPSLLFADESTTALDVTVQSQILELISKLRHDTGMGVVFVTHDLGVVAEVCDSVAVMYSGRIVERGPVNQILEDPRHPYTKGLIESMPTLGGKLPKGIEGQVPSPDKRPAGCAFSPRCFKATQQCTTARPKREALNGGHSVACFHPLTEEEVRAAPGSHDPTAAIVAGQDLDQGLMRLDKAACVYQTRSGPFKAAADISITLQPGESLAVIGESGSGKSTIGKLMLGVEKTAEGSATFKGETVPLLGTKEYKDFARKVQLVPQNPYLALDPRMAIGNQIEEPMEIHNIGTPESRRERMFELLQEVGLTNAHWDRYPHEISGGQCQRAVIARALSLEPELLICDEATASLDVSVQARIIDLLRDLQQQHHLAMVFITHDLRLIRSLCNRVAVMRQGQLVELNETTSLFTNPQHEYTRELLASVPDIPSEQAAKMEHV